MMILDILNHMTKPLSIKVVVTTHFVINLQNVICITKCVVIT